MNQYPLYEHVPFATLRELVENCAKRNGAGIAFQFERKKQCVNVSYSEFRQQTEALGAWLLKEKNQHWHIAVMGENSYEWINVYFAVTCIGRVIVPIDREASPSEVAQLLHDSDCTLLIYSETYQDIADTLSDQGIEQISMARLPELRKLGQTFLDADSTAYRDSAPAADDLASIVFTSGTTGHSKGVMLTHGNFAADTYGSCCNVLLEGTGLLVLPLHHTFGLVAGVFAVLYYGFPIYINSSLKRVATDLQKSSPQHMFAVPLLVDQLIRNIWMSARKQKKEKLLRMMLKVSDAFLKIGIDLRCQMFASVHRAFGGKLRLIVSGGAPIDEKSIRELGRFGITVLNGYGITECGPVVAVNRNRMIVPESVGVPLPVNQVKIAEDGEILVKGSNVMQGYYHDEAATRACFSDGWFCTGDLGSLTKEGALSIVGRKKNLIILGNGENIPAEPLEQRLMELDFVKEAIVYGKNDVITAEVYLDPDVENGKVLMQEMLTKLNQSLPQNMNIGRIIYRDTEFPKTTTKKIKRMKGE